MNSVTVKEWVAGPGSYQDKVLTFAELRETFGPGDLVTALMDEVERLQRSLMVERGKMEQADELNAKLLAEVERLRDALADMVRIAKADRWQDVPTGRRIILEAAEAVLSPGDGNAGR